MANWKDIKAQCTTEGFYTGFEFIDIKELVNKTFDITELTPFENDKGPGVAAIIEIDGKPRKMVTHSIGVVKTLISDSFNEALGEEKVTVTLKEGKSKKSGKYFYYLE